MQKKSIQYILTGTLFLISLCFLVACNQGGQKDGVKTDSSIIIDQADSENQKSDKDTKDNTPADSTEGEDTLDSLADKNPVLRYTTEELRLRTGPGTDYDVLTRMPMGAEVAFIESQGDWSKVRYGNLEGYASTKYLTDLAYPAEPTTIKGILLVNKQHPLPLAYNPGEDATARKALNQMLAACQAETGKKLTAFSGYRTLEYQKGLFDRYAASDGYDKALMYSARPRFSEHESGLAFDIGGSDQSFWLKEAFESTTEGIWLKENSANYGFILRYPKDKTPITGYIYEPWHFRYVGVDHAQEIYSQDITLEEYLLDP